MRQVEVTVIEQFGVEVTVLDAPGAQVAIGPTLSTATPQPVGLTGAAGTSGDAARADHVHAHGNQPGTSLHALATTSGAGFMSAAQFDLLDGATDQDSADTLVLRDASGDFEANNIYADLVGNAATATKLATARTINTVSFDGTNNITITAAPTAGSVVNATVASNAAIALTKLATGALPREITVASDNIVDGTIVNADINAAAAIALTKLASITAGQVLLGSAGNVPTATALSGDVTINSSGVTAISAGVIVNADISASAAIALSKLATGALPREITVASDNIVDGTIVNADINASAAIALSKLATGALPTAITVATANIVDGTIVNADINASAAIAGSKIAPDFGAQNVLTTGTITGASINPTGTTVPAAGLFRPATNALGWATNTLERARISPGGALLVGATTEPLGQIDGTVLANNKLIVGGGNHGIFQQYAAAPAASITATTGTIAFKFKSLAPSAQRAALVKIRITHFSASNAATDFPAAEYAFRLFNTDAGACGIAGQATIMEYQYVRATHFAFANLGSGECTVTLTNPTAVTLFGTQYAVEMITSGIWLLDAVTIT